MTSIFASVYDDATPMLVRLIAATSGPRREALNRSGGVGAVTAAAAYHRAFDSAGGWRGKRNLSTLTGGSNYGSAVAKGWSLFEATGDGATIANNAMHYRHKVDGGTIRAKNGKSLTIPLIPEAKGLRVRDYESETGRELFRPRKAGGALSNILAEELPGGKGFRPVYVLVKSVTQAPWPNALPPDDIIADAFTTGWRTEISNILESV